MKKIAPYSILLLMFILSGFQSDAVFNSTYRPIFMLRSDMESNVKLKGPESIIDAGKIYIKDHLIFINEKYRGIHVIDNSNPEDPTNIAFINIDGCIDMAVKDDILYADNAVDLIAIRFDPEVTSIEVTERIRDVFPELISPEGRGLYWKEEQAKPEGAILVKWIKR